MASILGDLWQLTDTQSLLNQVVLNVYYYRVTSVTGLTQAAYDDFLQWFITNVLTPVKGIQAAQLVHTNLSVRNLSNAVDFVDLPINTAGGVNSTAQEVLPPNITHTFRLVRESLVTRNGYKRFSGVVDGQISGGVSALVAASYNPINTALAADWVDQGFTLAEPIIPKRPLLTPAGAYLYSSIGGCQYRGIGTQNTRKIGRGV